MKTATYASVLSKASEYTGTPYESLTTAEAAQFRGFISTALRDIWEMFPWPETLAVEKFYFGIYPENDVDVEYPADSTLFNPFDGEYYKTIGAVSYGQIPITDASGNVVEAGFYVNCDDIPQAENYDNTLSYDPGTVVFHQEDGRYYAVKSAPSTIGYGPTSILSEMWGEVTLFFRDIGKLLDESGETRSVEIGEVQRITREDPRVSSNLTPVDFYLIGDTIRVKDSVPYVWVEYRTVPPQLLTDPTTIPYRFAEYVAQKAAAMMQLVKGNVDQGAVWAGMAETTLIRECDKVNSQEGQTSQIQVRVR